MLRASIVHVQLCISDTRPYLSLLQTILLLNCLGVHSRVAHGDRSTADRAFKKGIFIISTNVDLCLKVDDAKRCAFSSCAGDYAIPRCAEQLTSSP